MAMAMLLSNRGTVPSLSADDGAGSIEAYKRVIVESAADDSVRILDAKLKRHPWRGDGVQIELRWTCERSMKIRT
jgi:hypothetical protein